MKEKAIQYVCSVCGRTESKWLGRCPDCGSWNSFEEEKIAVKGSAGKKAEPSDYTPVSLESVEVEKEYRFPTGLSELDRVLGGGLMRGASILLGGEPGIGKSTLMLQAIANCSKKHKVLYVSGEESPSQVKLRAQRLKLDISNIEIFCDTRIEVLSAVLEKTRPTVLVVDSLQTLSSSEIASPAGSPNQIRMCCMELVGVTKRLGIAMFLIGHVTKEGALAGPKIVEHLVDTVLYFDQAQSGIRMVRSAKNRFGSVDEIGIFVMDSDGLKPVENPNAFFLMEREDGVIPAGIAFAPVVEGSRTFVVEIQALVVPAKGAYSHIYSDKIDSSRVTRVCAILERHAGIILSDKDIYINVAGGMKISETAVELPLALAIYSSKAGVPLDKKLVSFGELSLAGEVRTVSYVDKRMRSIAEMGFEKALVPFNVRSASGIKVQKCSSVSDVISLVSK